MPRKTQKNALPEEETSGVMDRLRQQREHVLADALYHLEDQAQNPPVPAIARPILLPALIS